MFHASLLTLRNICLRSRLWCLRNPTIKRQINKHDGLKGGGQQKQDGRQCWGTLAVPLYCPRRKASFLRHLHIFTLENLEQSLASWSQSGKSCTKMKGGKTPPSFLYMLAHFLEAALYNRPAPSLFTLEVIMFQL